MKPTEPEFWNTRYAAGRTPWDLGGVPAALTRWLGRHPGGGRRALIPGCGSGYEIGAFARAGYHVTAIDFSSTAVDRARAQVGTELACRVVEGDFFHHHFGGGAPFDVIYERTFLCALPPVRWPEIAQRCGALLQTSGALVGIYFFSEKDDGPPFGLAAGEDRNLFGAQFTRVADEPIARGESPALFAGSERWQEWRRT